MNGEYTMKAIGKISMAALSLLCVACSQKDNYPGATRIEWTDFPEERTLSGSEIHFSDEGLKPVTLEVENDGCFSFSYSDRETGVSIYWRNDPELHQTALREALPELYKGF